MTGVEALKCVLCGSYLRRSLCVMFFVGTVLTLINQGDVLFGEGELNWLKVFLTYCIPFCVASFGGWSALRDQQH